jgi:hypothetical protein
MNNPAYQKSLGLLAHPLTLAAMGLLLVNDHLLRRLWPSWWTGKIGDFAWLFFIPFACAVLLSLVLPSRWQAQRRVVAGLAFGLPAAIFILAKTLPGFHDWTVQLASAAFGFPVSWRRDPSDLVALASTGLAAWFWRREPGWKVVRVSRGWAALPLAIWLTVANAAAPEMGIRCLGIQNGTLVASATYQVYTSQDSGASWQSDPQVAGTVTCDRNADGNTVSDPNQPRIVYRYEPRESIERSTNGGDTWRPLYSLSPPSEAEQAFYARRGYNGFYEPGPLDALVDPASGNVLFAMGYEGVLLFRPAEERWEWVAVGNYSHVELGWLDYGDQLLSLVMGEILLAFGFGALSAILLAPRARRSWPRVILASIGWLLWGLAAFLFPPALTYSGYGSALVSMSILAAAVLIVPLGIEAAIGIWQEAPRSFPFYGLVLLANTILFLVPFLLWVTDLIPLYTVALYLALTLGAAALLVEYRQASRVPAKGEDVGPDRRRVGIVIFALILVGLSLVRAVLVF